MSFAPNNRSFYLMEFRDFHDRESNERNLEKDGSLVFILENFPESRNYLEIYSVIILLLRNKFILNCKITASYKLEINCN